MHQRRLEALRQALAHIGPHLEPIDHDVDGVLVGLGQLGQAVDVMHRAVHPQADETLCAQLGEKVQLFALAVGHHRGEDHQLRVFGQSQHVIDHLRHAVGRKRKVVVGTVRRAGAGVEQTQVIVDLGDGADGGARVVAGRLLLDGNRRTQSLDQVHVWFFHELQELPGVGRKRLDVAALALGVERVESQRGLAGAGQAGDYRQFVARQVEVDVLEIMCPRAANLDEFHDACC